MKEFKPALEGVMTLAMAAGLQVCSANFKEGIFWCDLTHVNGEGISVSMGEEEIKQRQKFPPYDTVSDKDFLELGYYFVCRRALAIFIFRYDIKTDYVFSTSPKKK